MAVCREQADAAVVIALDLEPLSGWLDDKARLIGGAARPVAEIIDLHFVALAVDDRIGLRRLAAEGEREIANRHEDRAELHRALRAEILVGDEAADQRRQVNQGGISAVETGRRVVAEDEMLGEIERQQRPHSVIAEPLPHLGREQAGELARMAEPGALLGRIDVARCRASPVPRPLVCRPSMSPLAPSRRNRATVTTKMRLVKPIVAPAARRYAPRSMLNDRSSILSLLETRRSGKPRELVGPGPTPEEMERILDHRGARAGSRQARRHGASSSSPRTSATRWRCCSARRSPRRTRARRPPITTRSEEFARYAGQLVVLISAPVEDHKIPVWEQELSCGAVGNEPAASRLMRSGYVAGWVTGWRAYSPMVRAAFCAPGERIAGFIFIGHAGPRAGGAPAPCAGATVVRTWQPPDALIFRLNFARSAVL